MSKEKNNVYIHPTAIVEENVQIGPNTRIWHFVHIRKNAKIGENCNIGKDVYIDTGVEIGNNVKIQNGVSVYRGVRIEDYAFIGPYAVFTNDLYPRSFNRSWEVINTTVKEGASIGANATIVCGVTIGKYSLVAAGSVVTRDVPDYGLVMGNPARLKGFVCVCGRPLKEIKRMTKRFIIYKCSSCGREIRIKRKDYERMLRESGRHS